MTDFETHPAGTARRLAELDSERAGLRQVVATLGSENRELRDELSDRLIQTRCGCGHPACKRCRDDAETGRVLGIDMPPNAEAV